MSTTVSHHFFRRTARDRAARMNRLAVRANDRRRYRVARRLGGLRWAVIRTRL